MKSISPAFIKRRTIVVAVLLFSCLTASAQVRLQRSMFRNSPDMEGLPHFLHDQRGYPDTAPGSIDSFSGYLAAQRRRGIVPLDEEDSTENSLRVQGTLAAQDTVIPTKSPGLAMLLSAIVPGAGQVYVHRYITIPIIWGFGYYFASAWITQNKRYEQYRDLFAESVRQDSTGHGNDQYQSIRDFYRDDRDKFAFYMAITYVLNIIDAYVGASLYSFDVSDNLGGSAALRIRIPIQ
jgi:hypothetical protein